MNRFLTNYNSAVIDTPTNNFTGESAVIDIGNNFTGLFIIIGIICVLLIGFSLIMLNRKTKNKKRDEKSDE